MTDTDRMQPIGKIPTVDYSAGREVREHFQAYRDYDLVHIPAVQTDLDGIDQARTVLDTAERDIRAYKAREAEADGDTGAVVRAKAAVAGRMIGRALAQVTAARALLSEALADPSVDLSDERWLELITLNVTAAGPGQGLIGLRRACAVIEGTAPAKG